MAGSGRERPMNVLAARPKSELAGKNKALARFRAHMGDLATAVELEDVARIDRELHLIEEYARDSGLFGQPEFMDIRLGRFASRWKLGARLAKIERAAGPRAGAAGPGRGKHVSALTSFRERLEQVKVDPDTAMNAQRIATIPPDEFQAFCERMRGEEDLPSFRELLDYARPYWHQENRIEKHKAIQRRARQTQEIFGPFPLWYVDPPWKFEAYSDKGLERSADRHYETLSDEEIINFKIGGKTVPQLTTKAAAMFLWCTSSNIKRAIVVMEAWGFANTASAAWDKGKAGLGLVFRNLHEPLLYGIKGDMPGPLWQPESLFHYPVGEHSAKPREVRETIERMYPEFDPSTRIELFARGKINGWTTYGLEAD
jgi:N6-adenosine-specific RNA methylase IME4